MKRACKDCEWYAPLLSGVGVYSETSGRCHRHVPDAENGWPYVSVEDWCGEFQPREEEKPVRLASVPCVDMFGHPHDRMSCIEFEPYEDSALCSKSGWCAMRRRPTDEKKEQE
ncbi:MAG: hypothetical protein M0R22_00135 [Dehalococcoidia bacterium]|jgi:hypothetical protein|nr:hypothetical protein [Dehalococcoidia bacterium]